MLHIRSFVNETNKRNVQKGRKDKYLYSLKMYRGKYQQIRRKFYCFCSVRKRDILDIVYKYIIEFKVKGALMLSKEYS